MQPTLSYNFRNANALNKIKLFVQKRGAGMNKRHLGIEDNKVRQLYLELHDSIDTLDYFIKNIGIDY